MLATFIDIGFGVIILIAVIVGLSVGFSRQFSRPLCGLIAIFGAIALTAVLYGLISNLGFYNGLVEKATGWFTKDFYTQQVNSVEDLSAALSSGYLRILSGSAEKIWASMSDAGVNTLGAYFGQLIIKVLAQFIIWLVLYLAIKYLLFGIKYLMTKISRVVVFKSIDKIFGLVWSLAITYIIVVGIILTTGEIVLAKFAPEIGDTVVDYISQTHLVKFFHGTNVIGSFISDLLSMSLLTVA